MFPSYNFIDNVALLKVTVVWDATYSLIPKSISKMVMYDNDLAKRLIRNMLSEPFF